ncbi:MAG: cytochrome c [Sphingomonadales bacterium]|jgi:cytochrome c5
MKLVAALALALLQAGAAAPDAIDLTPLPPGPGRELVGAKCSSCHNLAIVAGQRRDRVAWEQTIDQMMGRGAEISDADFAVIANYLGSNLAP